MVKKCFSVTKFLTINFVGDWLNGIKDLLGMEQKSYSDLVNEGIAKILEEIELDGEIIWFRQEVDRTFSKTIQVTIYGQQEVRVE